MTHLVKFKPAPGFVLLKPVEAKESTGLTLSLRPQNFCKVVAIGDAAYGEYNGKSMGPPCKVGEKVYHTTTGWEDMNISGEVYRIIKFQNILGTL